MKFYKTCVCEGDQHSKPFQKPHRGYIKYYSFSSSRAMKSPSNSVSCNCQKICSWLRRPETVVEFRKRHHSSRRLATLLFTSFSKITLTSDRRLTRLGLLLNILKRLMYHIFLLFGWILEECVCFASKLFSFLRCFNFQNFRMLWCNLKLNYGIKNVWEVNTVW